MQYNRKVNLCDLHKKFNKECSNYGSNFKNNPLMKSIVQNCPYKNGIGHKDYIKSNFLPIYNKLDLDKLKFFDSIGSNGSVQLIDGLSPKVFSYLKEIFIFYEHYLKDKINKEEELNLLVIGGGYGMEMVLLYYVLNLLEVKVNKILGLDMENVASLQNYFFYNCDLQDICSSYSLEKLPEVKENFFVYSNCCLAELNQETNKIYFDRYIDRSKGFFIVWGLWAADIPLYYKKYEKNHLDSILNDGLEKKRTNILFEK